MTGFARAAGADDLWRWAWEARSVNGRGLDLRLRLPQGLDRIDIQARALAAARFQRGSVSLALTVEPAGGPGELRIDRARLAAYLTIAAELQATHGLAPPSVDGLLSLRGVVEAADRPQGDPGAAAPAVDAALLETLEAALTALAAFRDAEGARLAAVLGATLDAIAALVDQARGIAAAQPDAIRARLARQLTDIAGAVPALSPERLAQEAALLAVRADIAEELARLEAHVAQARDLLAAGRGVGRKLEFLAQEFNREANTLCSKSADLELTRIGLELKTQIDRLREQAANVE
jgi:uncharacterized protein (TIGR00255 family)